MNAQDGVDQWLSSFGYYRKLLAHDETCFFRAVSEQASIIENLIKQNIKQKYLLFRFSTLNSTTKKLEQIVLLMQIKIGMNFLIYFWTGMIIFQN